MGLAEDIRSKQGLVASMEDVYAKQFLFLRNLADPVLERFGSRGRVALETSFAKLGEWRGINIRRSIDSLLEERSPLALIHNWDSGDFAIAHLARPLTISGTATNVQITFPNVLGNDFLKGNDEPLLKVYWERVLAGIANGYDRTFSITAASDTSDGSGAWVLEVRQAESTSASKAVDEQLDNVFVNPRRVLQLIRQSSQNNGALYMFIAREVLRTFDASGEQAIREGIRGIGRERGLALRVKHEREGKPLNLKTLMLDWDGPLVSTWIFRDEGHLSPGTWHQDCTYCPYSDVWAQYGPEGLALGYMYDMELHTTMYQTYHPGAVVQWEALKTRGDPVCKFRFSIPALVTRDDPQFSPAAEGERSPRSPQVPPL